MDLTGRCEGESLVYRRRTIFHRYQERHLQDLGPYQGDADTVNGAFMP